MTGSFYTPPNPSFAASQQPQAAPQGVPMGASRDQVIVDIPRNYDPQFAPVGADNVAIDEALAGFEARGGTAAPFDPDAYEAAQARAATQEQKSTPVEEIESIVNLTDQERADLADFFATGRRRGEVKVLGHVVHCHTLNSLDEMNVGKYVKDYMNTPGFVRAWTVATVAAGVRMINGKRIFDALRPIEDESELFEEKVRLIARAHPYVITPVYDKIQELDAEFDLLADKLFPPAKKPVAKDEVAPLPKAFG